MMDMKAQHRHIAALQRHWATLAARDAVYNQKRAELERKAGNLTLARGYSQEARWDRWWRDRRLRIAKREGGY